MSATRLALLLLVLAWPCHAESPPLAVQGFAPSSIGTILGRPILDPSGDEIGRLVDLLVDRDGQPRAAVIDVGGFLGIGMRRVAVAWEALRFAPDTGEIRIAEDVTTDEVAAAPEFRGTDQPVQVLLPRRVKP
jgi:hypothetical protein